MNLILIAIFPIHNRRLTGNGLKCSACRNKWLQDLITEDTTGSIEDNLECITDDQEAIPIADVHNYRNCCKFLNTFAYICFDEIITNYHNWFKLLIAFCIHLLR